MQDFSFEALDRWEAAESAHQAATAARAQAEDDWVDAVVREQEANERASSTARPAPAQNSTSEDERWQASLARFGLRLTVDAAGERGLATARAFGAGDELLRVAPTVAVLNEASRARRCHWSFAESERLLRCSACGYARYCSAACRKADAATGHALLCSHTPGDAATQLSELLDLGSESGLFLPLAIRVTAAIVAEAASGPEALRRLREAEAPEAAFDLVLLDHMMPAMAGDEVARQIRAARTLRQPLIVMASSMGAPSRAELANWPALDAFLTKPVRQHLLIDSSNGMTSED